MPRRPETSRRDPRLRTIRPLSAVGERGWLALVRRWFERDNAALPVPMGDDAAVLAWPPDARELVATADALIEGVHFHRGWSPPEDLGYKALAVNLSDLAAMAAQPVAALLTLSVPPETDTAELEAFFKGLRAAGRRWGCPLVGGDLTRAPQWCIAVAVLGRPMRPGRPARRDAARPGMTLYVTGHPGESGAGLAALEAGRHAPKLIRRHRRPTPRLAEAAVLARACPDLAMIDVSDGLWPDAVQLAEASGVRLELDGALPITPAQERLGKALGRNPLEWTLFGGEDYELLFATAVNEQTLRAAWRRAGLRTPLHRIGRVLFGEGVWLIDPRTGAPTPLADASFRHF